MPADEVDLLINRAIVELAEHRHHLDVAHGSHRLYSYFIVSHLNDIKRAVLYHYVSKRGTNVGLVVAKGHVIDHLSLGQDHFFYCRDIGHVAIVLDEIDVAVIIHHNEVILGKVIVDLTHFCAIDRAVHVHSLHRLRLFVVVIQAAVRQEVNLASCVIAIVGQVAHEVGVYSPLAGIGLRSGD